MKALAALLTATLLPLAATAAAPAPGTRPAPVPVRVEAYFTPGDDIAGVIAGRIGEARKSVHVAAYLFTHRRIASALARAARRGVEVELVGDAKQHANGGLPVLRELDRAGVRIWLSDEVAAFHHKFVVVDGQVVITGSYNFTQAAQERNAENVVVIAGDRATAARFVRDFARHRERASRLQ